MAEAKTTKPKAAKAVPPKSTAEKTVKTKPASPAKKAAPKSRKISAEERYKMIEIAAYYIAERHDFKGSAIDFWTAAEAEIDLIINK